MNIQIQPGVNLDLKSGNVILSNPKGGYITIPPRNSGGGGSFSNVPSGGGISQEEINRQQQELARQQEAARLKAASDLSAKQAAIAQAQLQKEINYNIQKQREANIQQGISAPTQVERDLQKQADFYAKQRGGVVSESLYKSIQEKAAGSGAEAQQAKQLLNKIGSVVSYPVQQVATTIAETGFLANAYDYATGKYTRAEAFVRNKEEALRRTKAGRVVSDVLTLGEPTTFDKKILEVIHGGEAISYYPFRAGGQMLADVGGKIETYAESRQDLLKEPIAYTGAGLQFAGELLPKDIIQTGEYYALGKAFKYAPKITATTLGTLGIYGLTKAETRKEKLGSATIIGLSGLGLLNEISLAPKAKQRLELSTKNLLEADINIPSRMSAFIGEVPLRQRATIILRDESNKILYGLDKNIDQYILPGGKIEKGETPLKAASRELFEETGIKTPLKYFDTIETFREKFIVFEGKISKAEKANIKLQAKEVADIKFFDVPKYVGKTAEKPFGAKTSVFNIFGKQIRAEDFYIGSRVKPLEKFAKLSESEKSILAEDGVGYIKKNFGKNILEKLTADEIAKEFFLYKKGAAQKSLIIRSKQLPGELSPGEISRIESFERKGKELYLKRTEKSWKNLFTGKKPGQFKKFFDVGKPDIVVEYGSRYDIPYFKLAGFKSDELMFVHATDEPFKTGYLELSDVGAERFLKSWKGLPKEINQIFEVLKLKNVRGGEGLYFQPPTTAKLGKAEAYLGAGYLGLAGSEELGITFRKPKPTIYEKKGLKGLSNTIKGIAGIEFEKSAKPGVVFKVKEKLQPFELTGKTIRRYVLEVADIKIGELSESDVMKGLSRLKTMNIPERKSFLRQVKSQTGRDYFNFGKKYVNPYETILKSVPKSLSLISEKNISQSKSSPVIVPERKTYLREIMKEPTGSFKQPEKRVSYLKEATRYEPVITRTPSYKPKETYGSYNYPKRDIKTDITYKYGQEPTKQPPYRPVKKPYYVSKSRKLSRFVKGFDLFIIKKRKPVTIARGLTRGAALDLGTRRIMKDLRATFGVKKSDLPARDVTTSKEFSRFGSILRRPTAKSAYNKYGDVFVQKSTRTDIGTGRLTSRGEKNEIQMSRRKMERYLR